MSVDRFVSYAQNAEDVVLARALRPDEHTGFWIDVGASDPVLSSVTAAFSERGWRGINVEPVPADYRKLCKARPDDVNLNIALGAQPGRGELFEGPPENLGCSTMRSELAERVPEPRRDLHPDRGLDPHPCGRRGRARSGRRRLPQDRRRRLRARGAQGRGLLRISPARHRDRGDRAQHHGPEPRGLGADARRARLPLCHVRRTQPLLCTRRRTGAVRGAECPCECPGRLHPLSLVPRGASRTSEHTKRSRSRTEQRPARVHQHDRATIALEEVAVLRKELDTAQRLGAQALAEADVARGQASEAREEAAQLRTEVHALRNTRLYRYTSPFRKAYRSLRRRRTRPSSG